MAYLFIDDATLLEKIQIAANGNHLASTAAEGDPANQDDSNPATIHEKDELVKYWIEQGKRNRERNPNALRSDQIDAFLYDENGLPA